MILSGNHFDFLKVCVFRLAAKRSKGGTLKSATRLMLLRFSGMLAAVMIYFNRFREPIIVDRRNRQIMIEEKVNLLENCTLPNLNH